MEPFVKSDTIELEITANTDITGWYIRAEFYDKSGNSVQLATENISGGSIDQIRVDDITNGVFTLICAKDLTTSFDNDSFLEIEREDANGKKLTIFQSEIVMKDEKITWSIPS